MLRAFAISVFANIRTIDRFGRQGGDELLLMLPDTDIDRAIQTLDRLRGLITELNWSAIAQDLALTISAGISAIRPNKRRKTFWRAPTVRSTKPRTPVAIAWWQCRKSGSSADRQPEPAWKALVPKIHRYFKCLKMAGAVGLEPTTTGFGDRYSTN